jgi:hypothetical protein
LIATDGRSLRKAIKKRRSGMVALLAERDRLAEECRVLRKHLQTAVKLAEMADGNRPNLLSKAIATLIPLPGEHP